MASGDGFTVVKRRRKHPSSNIKQNTSLATPKCNSDEDYCGPEAEKLAQKIALCRQQLKETQFYNDMIDIMKILGDSQYSSIVCYGIGHVGTCHIARHQLALLLELVCICKPRITWLYDPVLYTQENLAISKCGCQIIPKNEECKRRVEEKTLFYMPHCGKAMYNNVLWANWSIKELRRITIIGNSFNSYHEKLSSKQLREEGFFIYSIQKGYQEFPFPNSYPDNTVFNDISLHIFPQDNLSTLQQDTWKDYPEPFQNPLDPEIIT